MKTPLALRLETAGRRFHEVWGDQAAQNEFLKVANLILSFMLTGFLLGILALAHKPPIVIRVTDAGQAVALSDLKTNNAQSPQELIYYAKNFMRRYAEYNSYTLARDFSEALNMMTARLQKDAKRELVDSGFLARVREAELSVRIDYKEEKVERETPEVALVSLIAVRNITSYKKSGAQESALIKADLVLEKCARTKESPTGLLVDRYQETVLKELNEGRNQ